VITPNAIEEVKKDLMVYTKDEVDKLAADPTTLVHKIL